MTNPKARANASRGVDRRKLSKELRGPKLDDILPVESGGKNYEFKTEPRCKVCKKGHEFLGMVNALLATGATYTDVLRAIDPINSTFPENQQVTYSSLRTHQKRHLPYDSQAIRDIVEKRAANQQKDFIAGTGTLIDPASYAETMMYRAFQGLSNPAVFVEPKDGLAAAKVLFSITQGEERDASAVEMASQLNRLIAAVKAVVPDVYWQAVVAYLENEDATAEAEVVEEKPALTED